MHRTRLIAALPAILLACAPLAQAQADTNAVVRVVAGQAAGCGTLIHTAGQQGYVLTAAHVIESGAPVRATWHDGRTSAARVVVADARLDVALLSVTPPPGAAVIPLADRDHWPQQGDTVELIGYGGGQLRHWRASVNGYALTDGTGRYQTLSLNTPTIGGDSGGAIVWRGKLVGVIWGGPLAGPRGPMLATHGTSSVAIGPLLAKNNIDLTAPSRTQIIRPAAPNCRGRSCPLPCQVPPAVKPAVDAQQLLRAIARLEARIAELEQQPDPRIDVEDVSRRLLDAMASDARFRGPPGRDGRDGADGSAQPIDVDQLTDRIKQRLAGSIRVRVEPLRR